MKPELQRITATLTQLQQPALSEPPPGAFSPDFSASGSFSVTASPMPAEPASAPASGLSATHSQDTQPSARSLTGITASEPPTSLNLPRFKPIRFSNHRHATSPALPLSLLREIETIVMGWEKELHQVSQQIHELYQSGPMIDGWLESQPHPNATEEHTPLSHIEINRLLDSVQDLLNTIPTHLVTYESPRAGYRLCCLDSDGQMQCRPCPPEKVPAVSLAIARHHKLRQLLSQQQSLETRLNQLAQTLVGVHGSLQA